VSGVHMVRFARRRLSPVVAILALLLMASVPAALAAVATARAAHPHARVALPAGVRLLPAAAGAQVAGVAARGHIAPRVAAAAATLGLRFEQNVGQVDGRVAYVSRGAGYAVFLTGTAATLALTQRAAPPRPLTRGAGALTRTGPVTTSLVRLSFPGANPAPLVVGQGQLPGADSVLVGNDPGHWHTNIPTYGQVAYKGLYPGIDLVYHGSPGRLEYDWEVRAGANPSLIALSLEGGLGLGLDGQGKLVLRTGAGPLTQPVPVAYQEIGGRRVPVVAGYTLTGAGRVGFALGPYDTSRPLVIDPVLGYSTYLGGSGSDVAAGVAVDAAGDAYVAGYTNSTPFTTTTGTLQRGFGGGNDDAFVTKLNAAGTAVVYSTYLGGNGDDQGAAIAVDGSGDAYVAGYTNSSTFPTAHAAQGANGGGPYDAFVIELNAAGNGLVYGTYLGGNNDDRARSIALDPAGNAYVTGETYSGNFPTSSGALQTSYVGSGEAFVARINAGGALGYSTYLGAPNYAQGNGIAVDAAGDAYVAGYTNAPAFPATSGAYQKAYSGGWNSFVSKLNPGGNALVYSTFLAGANNDTYGTGIALDAAGDAYVAGYTSSTSYPTVNPLQGANAGGFDATLAELNASGSALLYGTYLGGSGSDYGMGIGLDGVGHVYVAGYTNSSSDFPIVNALQGTYGGAPDDAFVAEVTVGASRPVYSTYLGGGGDDEAAGLAVDSAGNVYVAGYTTSTNFPVTSGAAQGADGGGSDAFVADIAAPASTVTASPPAGATPTPTATAPTAPTGTPTPTATAAPTGTPTPTATATPPAAPLVIYDNAVENGFYDGSYNYSARNACDTSTYTSRSCSYAIAYTAYGGVNFGRTSPVATTPYAALEWNLNPNGQQLNTFLALFTDANGAIIREVPLAYGNVVRTLADGWVHLSVPVTQLNPSDVPISSVQLKNATGGTLAPIHVDDVQLVAASDSAPAGTSPFVLYDNAVENGFYDGSFNYTSATTCDTSASTSPSCSYAIAYTGYGGVNFQTDTPATVAPYASLAYNLNPNGQPLSDFSALFTDANGAIIHEVALGSGNTAALENGWVHAVIPLAQLDPAGVPIRSVQLKNTTGNSLTTIHVDDVQLTPRATFILYDNVVENGFYDGTYGYSAANACDLSTSTSPPCSYAITTTAHGGVNVGTTTPITTTPYGTLEWNLNPNGQPLGDFSALFTDASGAIIREVPLAYGNVVRTLADGWVHLSVPVTQLNPSDAPISSVQLKNATGGALAQVHMDDVQFVAGASTSTPTPTPGGTSTPPGLPATATATSAPTATAIPGATTPPGTNTAAAATATSTPTSTAITSPTPPALPTSMATPTATAIATPASGTSLTIDDGALGQTPNRFSYVGLGWRHCAGCTPAVGPAGALAYSGTYSQDNTANDQMTVAFMGTGISFYGVRTAQGGIGTVSIANASGQVEVAETAVHFYPVSAGGVTPALGGNQLLYSSPALANGLHVFTLRVTKTHDPGSGDYYVYPDRVDIARPGP